MADIDQHAEEAALSTETFTMKAVDVDPGAYRIFVVRTPEIRSGWVSRTEKGLELRPFRKDAAVFKEAPEGKGSFRDWVRMFKEGGYFDWREDDQAPDDSEPLRFENPNPIAPAVPGRLRYSGPDIRPLRYCKVPENSRPYNIFGARSTTITVGTRDRKEEKKD